jgi:hypothetical protein
MIGYLACGMEPICAELTFCLPFRLQERQWRGFVVVCGGGGRCSPGSQGGGPHSWGRITPKNPQRNRLICFRASPNFCAVWSSDDSGIPAYVVPTTFSEYGFGGAVLSKMVLIGKYGQ